LITDQAPDLTLPNAVPSVRVYLHTVSLGLGWVCSPAPTGPPSAAAAISGVNRTHAAFTYVEPLPEAVLLDAAPFAPLLGAQRHAADDRPVS
jgi:hypothetical protein